MPFEVPLRDIRRGELDGGIATLCLARRAG
jgi:hypothetical protein